MRRSLFRANRLFGGEMRLLARGLQLIGLLEVGYGLFLGLYEGNIGGELRYAAIGGAFFLAGWLIQKRMDSP